MTRIIRRIHRDLMLPTGRSIALGLRFNHLVWTKYLDLAWEATPLHEKLTWLLFLGNTLSILTIFQILAFKAM